MENNKWLWVLILAVIYISWDTDTTLKSLQSKIETLQIVVDNQVTEISSLKDQIENFEGNH